MTNMSDKTVFVVGGSGDLGREISILLAAKGAHITIFARRKEALEAARNEILAARLNTSQEINAVAVDMSRPEEVEATFRAQSRIPDVLYCAAGGTAAEHLGFFTDMNAADLAICMEMNYNTSAYSALSMLKIWTEDDAVSEKVTSQKLRQIVFINSAAALLGMPGYSAYTASKCAVRGLADTLRMEALRYSGPASKYTIHCAFPSNFTSSAFLAEQKKKPELTKKLEGTLGSEQELLKRFPAAKEVAKKTIAAVQRGQFAIVEDSWDSTLLFSNMVGPSPKRGLGLWDSLLAVIIGIFVWPLFRRSWDAKCRQAGRTLHESSV